VCAVWERLADSWGDAGRHEAFVALVAQYGCYAWAAARYHERAGDPIADAQLARLRELAVERLIPAARERRRRIGVIGLVGVLVGSLILVLVLGFLFLSSCGAR
jgi:hypothetical protein